MVNPLDASVRKLIVEELLQIYNKRLDSEQVNFVYNIEMDWNSTIC